MKNKYTHKHRQQCVDDQREGGTGAEWRWAKGGNKMETSVIMSTLKIYSFIHLNFFID